MIEVLPAILDKTFSEMRAHIESVVGIVKTVQIDFCDGIFVPSRTWPYAGGVDAEGKIVDPNFLRILNEEEGMPFWEEVEFEFHLMVKDGSKHFDIFSKLGPKAIVFQIEAESNIEEFKEFLEGIDPYTRELIQIGVGITVNTPVESIYPLMHLVDGVQCMGIYPIGIQGASFDEKVFNHIKALRENYPDIPITVDGSVNKQTAPRLVDAGVRRLVIGSALLNADSIRETAYEFQNLG